MNKIKELKRRRDSPCSWTGRVDIVKTSVLPEAIYKSDVIPAKIPAGCFVTTDKLILKFVWRGQRPQTANPVSKKNRVEGLVLPDFEM